MRSVAAPLSVGALILTTRIWSPHRGKGCRAAVAPFGMNEAEKPPDNGSSFSGIHGLLCTWQPTPYCTPHFLVQGNGVPQFTPKQLFNDVVNYQFRQKKIRHPTPILIFTAVTFGLTFAQCMCVLFCFQLMFICMHIQMQSTVCSLIM